MLFEELGIKKELIMALSSIGIKEPTPVQKECIPPALKSCDIIAEAQTGTGKTLAFLLPICQGLDASSTAIQSLIITPTRELAIQITEVAENMAKSVGANVVAAYGGRDTSKQINKLKGAAHIIVATPGRLLDHLGRQTADLSCLKSLVIDEADLMLKMGFKKEVSHIIRQTNGNRQTMCFSATIDSEVATLCSQYMRNPVTLSIPKESVTLSGIRQQLVEVSDRHKQEALLRVLREDNPFMAIIFCRTKVRVDKLEEAMHIQGFDCAKLHSDIQQSKREKIMKSFRKGDIQFLIATDVASRGLDISGVDNIYNYDIPENSKTYIHRTGRTGRAGQKGYTCMFVSPKDMHILEDIESSIGFKIERRSLDRLD